MPDPSDISLLPADFSGIVRLFPLPNMVLFPHVMQPLHIFEPRYREMLEHALARDSLLAMALLEPGWEPGYEGKPPISPVVCIGRVVSHARLEDGRFNILLFGARRARVTSELPKSHSFRQAEVELLTDLYPPEGAGQRPALQRQVFDRIRELIPSTSQFQEHFEASLGQQVSLGMLTDIAASSLSLPLAFKQQLLAECNVDRRAELLLEKLGESSCDPDAASDAFPTRKFPPEFSDN